MSDLTMKYTGEIIKKLREKKRESQEQLAIAINAPNRETVTRWENGTRDLKREHIIALAKHFNVTADYLLGLSDISSANADIQAACTVTGLSVEAIETFKKMKEFFTPFDDSEDESVKLDIESDKKRFYTILNKIIISFVLRDIVDSCGVLYDYSNALLYPGHMDISNTAKITDKLGISARALFYIIHKKESLEEKEHSSRDIRKMEDRCDLERYRILKKAEDISNMFDKRTEYLKYDKKELIEFLRIDEETLEKLKGL